MGTVLRRAAARTADGFSPSEDPLEWRQPRKIKWVLTALAVVNGGILTAVAVRREFAHPVLTLLFGVGTLLCAWGALWAHRYRVQVGQRGFAAGAWRRPYVPYACITRVERQTQAERAYLVRWEGGRAIYLSSAHLDLDIFLQRIWWHLPLTERKFLALSPGFAEPPPLWQRRVDDLRCPARSGDNESSQHAGEGHARGKRGAPEQ